MLWTANTERFCDIVPNVNDTADNLLSAIENNHEEISPSCLFAVASILENCPFINGSPQTTGMPSVVELANRYMVPIAGDDFKSGQTKMKSVLMDFLISSGIKPVSVVSYNHLGNNDGKNLTEAKQFRSKEISKSSVVDDMVSSNKILYPVIKCSTDTSQNMAGKSNKSDIERPDHVIVIKYVPAVGDSKRAMDEYESDIFMGGRSTISIHNVCEDSLLAAPLMLDLVLMMELMTRVSIARETDVVDLYGIDSVGTTAPGKVKWECMHCVTSLLSFMLKAPMVPSHAPVVNTLVKQREAIVALLRALIGLPAVDNLCLSHRLNPIIEDCGNTSERDAFKSSSA